MKKQNVIALICAILVMCAIIVVYMYKQLSDKNRTNNDTDALVGEIKHCEKNTTFDGKTYTYAMYTKGINFTIRLYDDNTNLIYESTRPDYAGTEVTQVLPTLCEYNNISLSKITSDIGHNYVAINWLNSGLTYNYGVYDIQNEKYNLLVDLSQYGGTTYKNNQDGNNETLDPYRIINNSIYVIEGGDTPKEKKYTFKNGKYTEEYTGNIYASLVGPGMK